MVKTKIFPSVRNCDGMVEFNVEITKFLYIGIGFVGIVKTVIYFGDALRTFDHYFAPQGIKANHYL